MRTMKNYKDITSDRRGHRVRKLRESIQPVTSLSSMKDGTKLADGIFAYQNQREKLSIHAFSSDS
jgi:hypothetical protein